MFTVYIHFRHWIDFSLTLSLTAVGSSVWTVRVVVVWAVGHTRLTSSRNISRMRAYARLRVPKFCHVIIVLPKNLEPGSNLRLTPSENLRKGLEICIFTLFPSIPIGQVEETLNQRTEKGQGRGWGQGECGASLESEGAAWTSAFLSLGFMPKSWHAYLFLKLWFIYLTFFSRLSEIVFIFRSFF